MERGGKRLVNITEDGLGRDLMNAGRFCFSCEQIFSSRKCLEEHICSATSFICSCGTEFTEYKDMLEHSTTHEPGHQVLDHVTIKKRRLEKRQEEEEQLKRLETGEVVWKPPKVSKAASISLPMKPIRQTPIMPQIPMQSSQITQVPKLYSSMSKASFLKSPVPSTPDVKNIFADVGAPTVDLWTLYQPVVLLTTGYTFNRNRPYTCGKCGQCFNTKKTLISHHSSHVTDKVSGCIGCGLLLSSRKLVPRFHVCNSPNSTAKFRIITARPLMSKQANVGMLMRAVGPQAGLSVEMLKSQKLGAVSKSSHAHTTSTLQLKNQNVRAFTQGNHVLHVSQSLKLGLHPSPFRPSVTIPRSPKGQRPHPSASIEHSNRLPVIPKRLQGLMNSPPRLPGITTKSPATSMSSLFPCRVCHIHFDTAQLLQRHKCVKAREFMAQHLQSGKPHFKRVTPVPSPNPAQMNGEIHLGIPASGNMKKQVMAVGLDKGQGSIPVNGITGVDMDTEDDCYIVETRPDKPSEMIYQVTSSVPIKT